MHTLIRLALSSFVLVFFLLHFGGVMSLDLVRQMERLSYDTRVRASTTGPATDSPVAILDIDERSMQAEGQWPWPRRKLARLLDLLYDHYGVRVVAFDIIFPEADGHARADVVRALLDGPLRDNPAGLVLAPLIENWDDDLQFAAAIARHRPVLGFVLRPQGAGEAISPGELPPPLIETPLGQPAQYYRAGSHTGNFAPLARATPYAGFVDNPALDTDGVFRRVPLLQEYRDAVYPSLALAALRRYLDDADAELVYDAAAGPRTPINLEHLQLGPHRVEIDEATAVRVPYRGGPGSFDYFSVTDVLERQVATDALRDRLVLIGTTAPGLLDLRTTPVGTAFPGVEVHANIIDGVLGDRIKHRVPYYNGISVTLLLIIALVLTLIFPRLSPLAGFGLMGGLALGVAALAMWAWFSHDFVMPLGVPLLAILAIGLLQTVYAYFIEDRGKREISRRFGTYVPQELVDEIALDPQAADMHSDSREMTVLFSDVRSFTTISEKLEPAELTELMNEFLTPLTGVIHEHRGTIDKYMGDAVMAFWGAPLPDEHHARHALEAGMAMVRCMRELAPEFQARGWPALELGVGVNTGSMSVGNMGSEFRVAYTVLGDAVNLGSRLEGLTKNYGVPIICGEQTMRAAPDWLCRELDKVKVKGKDRPVGIFEPLGPREEVSAAMGDELKAYRHALQAYRAQEWEQAELLFYRLSQLKPQCKLYQIYSARIAAFRKAPPGPDWDGVFTHTSK